MKKMIFWLITDLLWYLIFVLSSGIILYFYDHTMRRGSSDGDGLALLFFSGVFFIINILFVLIQSINTAFSNKNKERYLKRKFYLFLTQSILLFLPIIIQMFGAFYFSNEDNPIDLYYYPILFVVVSNVIYYLMVKELGKMLEL